MIYPYIYFFQQVKVEDGKVYVSINKKVRDSKLKALKKTAVFPLVLC